jgi:cytochrome c oxidase assembly factor 6
MSKKGSSDSGIPLRDERKVCYEARDLFFTCCDKNNIDNPLGDGENVQKLCRGQKAKFEKDCIASWVYLTQNDDN